MQQVKLKSKSMEEARHGNDNDYYLFAITNDTNGKYAVIKYVDVNRWRTLTVNLISLEAVELVVTLPCTRSLAKCETLLKHATDIIDHLVDEIEPGVYEVPEGDVTDMVKPVIDWVNDYFDNGKISTLTDDDIRAMWVDAGGALQGSTTETATMTMTEARIIKFIRSLL